MICLEMINRGWILRNKIIWQKTNVMPESVRDRFTNDYEEVFFFTKKQKYFFNKLYEPYAEKTLNSFKNGKIPNSHKYLEAGKSKCGMREGKDWVNVVSEKGRNMRTVLDIFLGSGTTLIAAKELNIHGIGIELVKENCELSLKRLGS